MNKENIENKRVESTMDLVEAATPKWRENLTFLILLGALLVNGIGFLFVHLNVSNSGWTTFGSFLISVGGATLGGGVFSVILKSGQFSEVFQNSLFRVFYDPIKASSLGAVHERWLHITSALLKEVLPKTYVKASEQIFKKFLDDEVEYHFEDLKVHYEFSIDNNELIINSTSTALIVLSKSCSNPELLQTISLGGESKAECVELEYLRLGKERNLESKLDYELNSNTTKPNQKVLRVPLLPYASNSEQESGLKVVEYEKRVVQRQALSDDAYTISYLKRFTRSLTVSATVKGNYKPIFATIYDREPIEIEEDNDSYKWVLAGRDDLLLPGHGYIIMIVPK